MARGSTERIRPSRGMLRSMSTRGILLAVLASCAAGALAWIAQEAIDPVRPFDRGRGAEARASAPLRSDADRARTTAAPAQDTEPAARVASGAATASALGPTHLFRGRVVDGTRRPVAGARVAFQRIGAASTAVETDAEGRFALPARIDADAPRAVACLEASDGAGRVGRKLASCVPEPRVGPAEVDAGTLVLAASHALTVRVSDSGQPAAGARVEIACGHARLPVGTVTADTGGVARVEGLPAGAVYLNATLGERGGRALAFVPDERETRVALQALAAVELRVVEAGSARPIEGAEVELIEAIQVPLALPGEEGLGMGGEYVMERTLLASALTDADGRLLLRGLPRGARTCLRVRAAGCAPYPDRRGSNEGFDASRSPQTIELSPLALRRVRFPLVAGEVPAPAESTALELRAAPGSLRPFEEPELPGPARIEGGELVVEAVTGRVALVAIAPDGALAELWASETAELGRETSFRRPRAIELVVRDARGAPVEGATARATNQGNNELAKATTDAEGRARMGGLYGGLAEVSVSRSGELAGEHSIGSVDLERGDAKLECSLSDPMRARLACTIDGRPALPGRFRVWSQAGARVVEELPERGELVVEIANAAPGESSKLSIDALGFLPALVDLELPADGSEARASVALEPAAVLVAHVSMPSKERVEILPERFDEESGAWKLDPRTRVHQGLTRPNGFDSSFVFARVAPGRWRVVDEKSGIASEEIEVRSGAREARVELELGGIQWASGRVELPDASELERVRVVVEGGGEPENELRGFDALRPSGARVDRDGSFRVRVPGDRPVRLVPWHPWLAPAREGSIELRDGREGIVLRLVEADEVVLRIPQVDARELRVARYAGDPSGEPIEWRPAPIVDGRARFAAPRGRWTFWIDPTADFAPFVLRGIAVDGRTELDAPALDAGSSLRVHLLVPEGSAPPRIGLFAFAQGEPSYTRGLNSRGEAEVVLAGLGAGRFRVSMGTVMAHGDTQQRELELDGKSDRELELDLR